MAVVMQESRLGQAKAFRDRCLQSILRNLEAAGNEGFFGPELFARVAREVSDDSVRYRWEAFESHLDLLLNARCISLTPMERIQLAA